MVTKKKTTKSKTKSKALSMIFSTAYIANMIGRDFPKFPTLTASDLAMELAIVFMTDHWDGDDETHVDEMDRFLSSKPIKKQIEQVAKQY